VTAGTGPDHRTVQLVRAALAERTAPGAVARLRDDEPLAALGLDSVALIALVADLQQRAGASLDDEAVFDPEVSVASLAAVLAGTARHGTPDVVVAGIGAVGPTGCGVDALWTGLLAERATRIPVPYPTARSDLVGVLPGAGPADVSAPGRLLVLICAAAEEALAGSDAAARARTRLVVGTTDTGGNALARALDDPAGAASGPTLAGTVADRAAAALGLGGAAVTVGSASASGAVALGYGRDLLRAEPTGDVLVIGADTVSETAWQGLAALRTLSPDGCRPFSSRRRGIALSEAAAACLLRSAATDRAAATTGRPDPGPRPEAWPPSRAARLTGYGASSLTSHLVTPESGGIELAVRRALADAGAEAADVSFVNAHGPGTKLGDLAEAKALRAVFGERVTTVPVGSVKGLLGHCQGAAGVIESLVCLLSLAAGTVPPTTGCEPLDPAFADLDVVVAARPVPDARRALSISCGLGGVNTAVVWECG
jgi:3-oxoacyl-[acyl-carrier-protein] synthase II